VSTHQHLIRTTACGLAALATLAVSACSTLPAPPELPELQAQVQAAERDFAATMAARDYQAFLDFVSEEALFFGSTTLHRGRKEVGASWRSYFDGAQAPFSWEPDRVEVLASGTLALSTGPVRDESGKVTSRFNSIWRRESDGRWRVIFDKGQCLCGNP
jgi:ketosteroid isomerase-like protein